MGIQLSRLVNRRIIICTPTSSGQLVKNKHQIQAPVIDTIFSKNQCLRGQDQVSKLEKQNNLNKNKKLKFNSILENLKRSTSALFWVGGFVALNTAGVTNIGIERAQAADAKWNNADLAKKVVENVAPIISAATEEKVQAPTIFTGNNFIEKPLVVETQVTVEPPAPAKPASVSRAVVQAPTTVAPKPSTPKPKPAMTPESKVKSRPVVTTTHRFPAGYCTYYVAQRRPIPWGGNAGTWLSGAKSYGFATGRTPQAGAIMVTTESPIGHVAYVEAVNGDQITVSEMNYAGFGVVSRRTLSANSYFIKGFIY